MRIRYTNDVDIRVEYPHDLPTQVSIPPLLLIVFVENAFKHGVSYNHPSFIHMHDRLRRRQGHRHDQQQPPHAERRKTQRRNRTGQCPQASGTDLRPPELHARHPRRKPYDIHRKTRNTDPQCLSVSPLTTSRWLCVRSTSYIREDSLSGPHRFVQQRTRSPAVSRRTACRPDLRRYQHARPERRGVRPCAGRKADGDLHHRLLGVRRRRVQARRGGLPAQAVQLRRLQSFGGQGKLALRTAPQPATGRRIGTRFRRRCPKTRSISR